MLGYLIRSDCPNPEKDLTVGIGEVGKRNSSESLASFAGILLVPCFKKWSAALMQCSLRQDHTGDANCQEQLLNTSEFGIGPYFEANLGRTEDWLLAE